MEKRIDDDRRRTRNRDSASSSDAGELDSSRDASERATNLARADEDEQSRQGTSASPMVLPGGAAIGSTNPSSSAGSGDSAAGAGAGALALEMSTFGQDDVKVGWPVLASDDTRIGTVEEVGPERLLIDRSDMDGKIYIPFSGVSSIEDRAIHLIVDRGAINSQDWQQILPSSSRRASSSGEASPVSLPSTVEPTRDQSVPEIITPASGSAADKSTVPPRPSETDQTARPPIHLDPAASTVPPVTSGRGVEEGPTSHTVEAQQPDPPTDDLTFTDIVGTDRTRFTSSTRNDQPRTMRPPTLPIPPLPIPPLQTPPLQTPPKEMGPMQDARNMFGNVKDTMTRNLQGQGHPEKAVEDTKEAFADMFSFLENIPNSFYYLGTIISVMASLWLFVTGKRLESIFVGLWAPTIISASMFYKLLRPSRGIRQS